jgi:hypothetical protein
LETEITAYKASLKAQMDELYAQAQVLKTAISTRREYRMVPCIWKFDWKAGIKNLVRNDTKEAVNSLAISDAERQEELKLTGGHECPICKKVHTRKGKYCSKECKITADSEARAEK